MLAVTIGTRGSLAFICISPIHAQSPGSFLEKGCETKMYPDRSQHVLFRATYFFPGFFPFPPRQYLSNPSLGSFERTTKTMALSPSSNRDKLLRSTKKPSSGLKNSWSFSILALLYNLFNMQDTRTRRTIPTPKKVNNKLLQFLPQTAGGHASRISRYAKGGPGPTAAPGKGVREKGAVPSPVPSDGGRHVSSVSVVLRARRRIEKTV